MELAILKQKLRPLCIETGIDRLGVFGSVARGEDTASSDIDLIARFRNPIGLMDLIGIEIQMKELLGRNVDLGTEASLHPLIKDNVQKDLTIIYEG